MTKFVLRENPPENLNEAFASLSDFVKRHLFHINIKDKAEVEAFISPDFDKNTHNPFLLKDMDKAVTRIFQAINADEKICIYSDYDADGVPAAVVLHDFFKKIGFNNFINYIPHRNKEGFGINAGAIEKIIEQEVKLIISVDCGIADIEPVKKHRKLASTLLLPIIMKCRGIYHQLLRLSIQNKTTVIIQKKCCAVAGWLLN